jgi:hypothetical protein
MIAEPPTSASPWGTGSDVAIQSASITLVQGEALVHPARAP